MLSIETVCWVCPYTNIHIHHHSKVQGRRCTYTLCVCVHRYLALGLSEFSGDTLLGVLWWCALGAGGLTRPTTPPTPELWKVEENEEEEDEEEGSELDDEG